MSTDELMRAEAERLIDLTLDALMLTEARWPTYHLAGIDDAATDALLRRDGLLPTVRANMDDDDDDDDEWDDAEDDE